MSTIKVAAEVKQEIYHFRQFMLEHEYTEQTTLGYSAYISRYLRWSTEENGYPIEQSIRYFLEVQLECNPENYNECRAAVHLYFKMLTGNRFPGYSKKVCSPEIEVVLNRFYEYSVNIKRIQPNSAKWEMSSVRKLLEHALSENQYSIEAITSHHIRDYVIQCLAHLADSSKGRTITAIRNFFKFQKFEGVPVHESIFLMPLSPAVWKNSTVPALLDYEKFDRLYEKPDTSTATGKRDRCIILCFTELALRCVEVAALTLDDFDWREGVVLIKNTKNCLDRKLPISAKLSQAVIEYLKDARPQTDSRALFIKFRKFRGQPMRIWHIRSVVRKVLEKYGDDVPSTGTRILRQTAGSKIYNAGNSLKMAADILGHESLDSTALYVKTDKDSLRQAAAPWPRPLGKVGA